MKDFEVSGPCPLSNTSKLSRSSTRFQSLPANCTLPWVQGWPELERINIKRKATHVGCVTRFGCLGLVDVFSHVFVLSGASRLCGPQEALRRCSRRDRTSGGRHPRALQPLTFLKHISCEIPAWRKFICSPGPWLPVFGGPWLRQSLEIEHTEHTDAEFAEDVVQSLLWLEKSRSFEGISYGHAHDCQARWSHWNT